MRINRNIAAFNAYRNLSQSQGALSKSLEKLSSGFRTNRAADDAAGLVNSENLRAQIGGLKVATRNAQDAISLVQTAEGAQTEVHSILQRMRDLTVQSGNKGTNDQAALDANQAEVNQLVAELDRISAQTQFGTKQILNSTDAAGQAFTFQVGANATQQVTVNVKGVSATSLGVNALQLNTAAVGDTDAALTAIDAAIKTVSENRATLGAFQNRMASTIRHVSVAVENLSAAESRIRDTDMAQEMVALTRNQILQRAGMARPVQADQVPQSALSLLR